MQMMNKELAELFEQACENGAERALARLGLADDNAPRDMADLRELLSAWRDAKKSVRSAIIGWIVKTMLAMLLIGLAVRLGLGELIVK